MAPMGAQDLPLPQHQSGRFCNGNSYVLCSGEEEVRPGMSGQQRGCVWLSGVNHLVRAGLCPTCPRGHTLPSHTRTSPKASTHSILPQQGQPAECNALSCLQLVDLLHLHLVLPHLFFDEHLHAPVYRLGQFLSSGWGRQSQRAAQGLGQGWDPGIPCDLRGAHFASGL